MNDDADIFAAALELPGAQRVAFVVGTCADPAQRLRILALLEAHEKVGAVLPEPRRERPDEPNAETVIGRFKLLEKIGEGGCGVVWMAEQEEPVRRRVALKVIKLGMDTREVVARFEAERQALAMMSHPNIAQVFEAGATESGRPYFAMELVRGLPITRYCDERKLSPPERLALFVQVCRALQHAHEKGVVHRDIKPSNVLVTHDGDAPMPKVIDFGIAKATQGRLTDHTLFTAFEQFIGTPAYMSPEQADFHAQEIDARSDVYSLGALLYELLAGRPPFDPKALVSQGIDEVRRIIREVDPPRLSTKLTTLSRAERATHAECRGVAPAAYAPVMDGDLDWIAMKALEKNRARRYESAAALAADVQRHLDHKPVVARPPGFAYVAQKFARRHRVTVLAGSAVAAALVVGAITSLWQARRATRAEIEREEFAVKNRGSPLVQLVEAGQAARPLPPDPASPAAVARAREFIADVRENYFHDSLLEVGEDRTQERAEQTLATLDLVPAGSRWPEWARDRAIVAARLSLADRRRGEPTAMKLAETARAALEDLRTAGDASEDATVLLAMALYAAFDPIMQQRLYGHPEVRKRTEALQQAENLLLPLAVAGRSANRARHVLAEVMLARGEHKRGEAPMGFLHRALAHLDEIDETERSQPRVLLTKANIVVQLGMISAPEESKRRQAEALQLAAAVLAQQPLSASAQRVRFWAFHSQAQAHWLGRDYPACAGPLVEAERVAFALHQRDLSCDDDWYLLIVVRRFLADNFIELGRIADAAAVLHQTTIDAGHPATQLEPAEGGPRRFIKGLIQRVAFLEAARGNGDAADVAFQAQQPHALGARSGPDTSQRAALAVEAISDLQTSAQFKILRGDYDWVITHGQATVGQLRSLLTGPASQEADRSRYRTVVGALRDALAEALIHRGQWAAAEAMLIETRDFLPRTAPPHTVAQRIWLALAVARQGRGADALKILAPALATQRRVNTPGRARLDQRELLARALFVEAIAQPATDDGGARRRAALAEVQEILDAMSTDARQLHYSRVLARWIAEERKRG